MPGGAWPGNTISAAYYNGNSYFGYIDGNGNIRVSSYNHATHAVVTSPAILTGLTIDLHSAPSVLVRQSDHKIVIAIAPHDTAHMYIAVSTNAEDVSAWGSATDIQATLGDTSMTYANLFQLSGESGKIYLFYRQGSANTVSTMKYSTSTDGGATWAASTSLFAPGQVGGYMAIDCDSASRIDFAVSDGDPSQSTTGSLYHFFYTGGSFFKTDGTLISTALPLTGSNVTEISNGATDGSVRAPFSIIASGGPYVVWAAANPAGWATNPENYLYAEYSGGSWHVHTIANTGANPTTAILFEGGITLSRSDPSRVFLATVSGGQYQVLLYTTPDGGTTWSSTPLSSDTEQPNWHPISPRDQAAGLEAIWLFGPTFANSFASQIRGYPNPIGVF